MIMFTKRYAVVALVALLFGSQPLLAQEASVQSDQGAAEVSTVGQPAPGAVEAVVAVEPAPAQEMTESSGATDTGGPGEATNEQAETVETQGMAMHPGMPGPGKKGCRVGKAGMMGMMHGVMGKGGMRGDGKSCMTKSCDGHSGISKRQYRELMGRLDVLDARLAKIDAMLERLLER
jgi:hypothetical protein